MNQGTQGYSLMKKTEGRKSRDTVSLKILHVSAKVMQKQLNCYMADNVAEYPSNK
jgi:hypothetical protein